MNDLTRQQIDTRTEERVQRLYDAAWNGRISAEAFKGLVRSTLKEQDRDTRHACAEAVLASNPRDSAHDHPLVVECFTHAHQACMNAHAV